ncbi:hypothetical protein [Microbacter margulisiae]|uniref:Uncharacterized protein n=1 Tax=Microbacter margulisiae TaxID=1350067 RepID=A0A7W5H1A4_9PORP|nr:hypothetical protein [Microbacter margulisiae]MBB3187383.1 hypothetical protein [Microbacter margulisiae]
MNKREFVPWNEEGEFWETASSVLLQKDFERNEALIESFGMALENELRLPNEDIGSFIQPITNDRHKKKWRGERKTVNEKNA